MVSSRSVNEPLANSTIRTAEQQPSDYEGESERPFGTWEREPTAAAAQTLTVGSEKKGRKEEAFLIR